MKLMGASRLLEFAGGAPWPIRGLCASLLAELEAGAWQSREEVIAAYPLATWEGERVAIPLDEQSVCVVAFNYRSGIALIESAGLRPTGARPAGLHRRAGS